jgi:hypothetical protein
MKTVTLSIPELRVIIDALERQVAFCQECITNPNSTVNSHEMLERLRTESIDLINKLKVE